MDLSLDPVSRDAVGAAALTANEDLYWEKSWGPSLSDGIVVVVKFSS